MRLRAGVRGPLLLNSFRRLWRGLGSYLPGARERRAQTTTYLAEWSDDNAAAQRATGPLWVVLGDSTAQGIGTSRRDHSYVSVVARALRERRDSSWRVVNLS